MILFSKFEYSHTGYVSVAVSSAGISSNPVTSNASQPADPSRIGFFLLSQELSDRYHLQLKFRPNPDLYALDIKNITVLFTFRDLSPPPHSSFNTWYHVTYPGNYLLFFANCNNQSLVTMNVRTELYNLLDDGTTTTKDYLSAREPQPSDYFRFFLIYLCFLGFWTKLCFKNQQQRFQMIHLLMYVLLLITVLHFIFAVADQHDIKVTGSHHGWHVMFYIFQFMRNVVLFTIIVLIGVGWCFWRWVLPLRDMWFLTLVILLRVVANVTYIVAEESGLYYEHRVDLDDVISVIDITCCIVICFYTALVCCEFKLAKDASTFLRSFSSLKETSVRPDVFPVLVLVYLMFMASESLEMTIVAKESFSFVFSMVMFYMYRPSVVEDEGENCKKLLV